MKKEVIKEEVKEEEDIKIKEELEEDNKFLKANKIIRSKRKYFCTSKYLEDQYNVN